MTDLIRRLPEKPQGESIKIVEYDEVFNYPDNSVEDIPVIIGPRGGFRGGIPGGGAQYKAYALGIVCRDNNDNDAYRRLAALTWTHLLEDTAVGDVVIREYPVLSQAESLEIWPNAKVWYVYLRYLVR